MEGCTDDTTPGMHVSRANSQEMKVQFFDNLPCSHFADKPGSNAESWKMNGYTTSNTLGVHLSKKTLQKN